MRTIPSDACAIDGLPLGMSMASAELAMDGPREQQIAELLRIIRECDRIDSCAARELGAEAAAYIAEIEE